MHRVTAQMSLEQKQLYIAIDEILWQDLGAYNITEKLAGKIIEL